MVLVRVTFAADGADAVPGRTEQRRGGGSARPEGWDVIVDELAGHPGYHVTLATDAMSDLDAVSHAHSIERIFPRLGETGTSAEVLELLAKTHGVS